MMALFSFNLINQIFVILIAIIDLWLGFWVYFADRRGKVNRLFLLLALFLFLWIIFCFLGNAATKLDLAIFLAKLAYGATSVFLIYFYLFFIHFLGEENKFPKLNKFILFACIFVFFIVVFTDLMVENMQFTRRGAIPILGWGQFLHFGLTFFITFFIISRLLLKYFKISKEEKLKIQYFLIGILILIFANLIFNVILAAIQGMPLYYDLGNYSAIFFLGFTAFAIVKRQLFGIKVVLTALLSGAIAVSLLIQIFIAPSLSWKIIDGAIFIIFSLFAYYLVKAVQGEERRREEAEMMVVREGALRKRAEKLADEFKRLDENKTQFMLATQHHLRTPLTAIQGYLSMLYDGSWGRINPEARSKIKSAFDSTRKLIKLVNEFLDIAQFEVGKEAIVKREIQIEEAVREVVQDLKPEAEKKELYLKFEKPEAVPKIMADPEKIKEALYNVIYNAIKYTRKGGVEVKLEKTADGKSILCSVKDTGIGMKQDVMGGLFQKSFSRGEEAKKLYTTGRGIGLYLAYQIVKAHGGRIWAESEGEDKGSTFYIELPVK